jgi:hypothetical protein
MSEKLPEVLLTQSVDNLDDADAFAGRVAQEIDPAIEKRVRRKLDLFFMPTFIVGYGLVYYDKVAGIQCKSTKI